ncbi:MAG: Fe-S cluster assembly protein SufD [Candidatus Woesearchaeota archaeon]
MQPRIRYGLTIQLNTKGLLLVEQPEGESVNEVQANNCSVQAFTNHNQQHKTTVFEPDVFTEYQERNAKKGLLIHVPANQEATVNLRRTIKGQCVHHILVIVEENAKLHVMDEYVGSPDLHVAAVEIIAYENAQIKYATTQKLKKGFDIVNYRARTHKNASIDWFIAQYGATLSRAIVDTELVGEGSSTRSYGVYLGREQQQFERTDASIHVGNHTASDMHARGVLQEKSKAVFRGTIDIAKEAFTCDGYQKNHTLLLSENAVADAIPNLQIRNNDVKCSHGATIGRVDEEHLFYLTSRGIDKQTATRILVEGFFAELANALEWPQLTEHIIRTSEEYIV